MHKYRWSLEQAALHCLKDMFYTLKIPYSMKTDKGAQFISEETEMYFQGKEHWASKTYHTLVPSKLRSGEAKSQSPQVNQNAQARNKDCERVAEIPYGL